MESKYHQPKNILKHPAHYTWDTLIVKRLSESKKVSFLFLNECIVQYTILSTLNHMQLNTHQLFLFSHSFYCNLYIYISALHRKSLVRVHFNFNEGLILLTNVDTLLKILLRKFVIGYK